MTILVLLVVLVFCARLSYAIMEVRRKNYEEINGLHIRMDKERKDAERVNHRLVEMVRVVSQKLE